jgi:hypothetical protein
MLCGFSTSPLTSGMFACSWHHYFLAWLTFQESDEVFGRQCYKRNITGKKYQELHKNNNVVLLHTYLKFFSKLVSHKCSPDKYIMFLSLQGCYLDIRNCYTDKCIMFLSFRIDDNVCNPLSCYVVFPHHHWHQECLRVLNSCYIKWINRFNFSRKWWSFRETVLQEEYNR